MADILSAIDQPRARCEGLNVRVCGRDCECWCECLTCCFTSSSELCVPGIISSVLLLLCLSLRGGTDPSSTCSYEGLPQWNTCLRFTLACIQIDFALSPRLLSKATEMIPWISVSPVDDTETF